MYEIIKDWIKHIPFSGWIILIYPVFMALIMRPRDFDAFMEIDSSANMQLIFTSIAALWALNRIIQRKQVFLKQLLRTPLSYLFAYMLFGLTSTLWSSYPLMTLYRSIEGLIYLVLIIDCVHASRNNMESSQILIMFCLIGCLCDITRGVLSGSDLLNLHGSIHSSPLAAAGLFISLGSPNRAIRLWITAVLFLIVIVSTSSGSYIAVLIGTGTLFLLKRDFNHTCIFIFVSLLILTLFIYRGIDPFTRMLFADKTPDKIATLSGRTDIWRWYWEERISKRLILGYGYDAGDHQLVYTHTMKSFEGHNVAVSAAACLGVSGLLLICLLCASMLRSAFLTRNFLYPYLFTSCLVVWINSITSLSIASRINVVWLLTAWLCVIVTHNRNLTYCSIRPYGHNVIF